MDVAHDLQRRLKLRSIGDRVTCSPSCNDHSHRAEGWTGVPGRAFFAPVSRSIIASTFTGRFPVSCPAHCVPACARCRWVQRVCTTALQVPNPLARANDLRACGQRATTRTRLCDPCCSPCDRNQSQPESCGDLQRAEPQVHPSRGLCCRMGVHSMFGIRRIGEPTTDRSSFSACTHRSFRHVGIPTLCFRRTAS